MLAGLLLVALILRMPGLKESLWFDETYYSRVMLESPNWRHYVFHDVHPPLYPLLMKLWNLGLGESEIRLRLPSLMAGLLSVAICYRLGRQWFGREVGCLLSVDDTDQGVNAGQIFQAGAGLGVAKRKAGRHRQGFGNPRGLDHQTHLEHNDANDFSRRPIEGCQQLTLTSAGVELEL